ncbi:fimbrial protein [Shewanella putrefaciens]|uniref:fimbrial protein n=1 Tax=Shewanella putrefaciens TaxID=24 RepID=UPI00242ED3F5|nr:fimbrial protein [Shewanella putrefaciens]MCA1896875.1 type 1 fimbrial protein [Shewanella putrefaciens]
MKKITLALAASGLLLGSSAAMAAGPNTITFMGEVTDQTCEVEINGNAANPVVLLPTATTAELAAAGSTAKETTFTLGIKGCDGTALTSKTVFVGNVVDTNGNLTNTATGGAVNVALQLLDAPGGAAIDLNTTTPVAGVVLAAGETEGTVDYAVQYYSEAGGATAGAVLGSVQYAVSYQ